VALVLAGGSGTRMGRPKQFIELLGHPALLYTLRAFEEAPSVKRIYAVGDKERVEALARGAGVRKYAGCAEPGETRSLSTRSGLLACEGDHRTVVLVHDGCRCLVTPDLIERVAAAALSDHPSAPDGVIPALPVFDTVKMVEGSTVLHTVDRSKLYAVQTPQAFALDLLHEVHAGPEEMLRAATDDASLVEGAGKRVEVVLGERTNIKLTSPEDLILAEAILQTRDGSRVGPPWPGSRADGRAGSWRRL
jgi:2-C-methyl-D-erythritol 4-phosphate cytidylyltransferase